MTATCGRKLAPGQWWSYCGETDMGQTAPVQCVECEPRYGYLLDGASASDVDAQNRKRDAAMERYKEAGYIGNLEDYWP